MNQISVLLAGVFCLTVSANAADLLTVVALAKKNDAQYAEAQAKFEAGKERLIQGRSGVLPTLAITGSSNDVSRKFTNPESDGIRYQSNQYALTLNQPLFRWQNWLQYEQGGLQVAQSEAEFFQASQDLLLRSAQAYFDVLLAEDTVRSLETQRLAIEQQLAQAKAYFEVGTATITDTHEAQARFDLAEAQLIAAKSDHEVKLAALQISTGEAVGKLADLKDGIPMLIPQPNQLDHWVQQAETRSPSVQAKSAYTEVAKLEASKQQAGHLPTLDLVGSMGKVHDYTFTGGTPAMGMADLNQNMIGVQLNIPLFQGGVVSSRARESAANYLAARANLESTKRLAAQSARQSYLGVINGAAQVKALEAAEKSSRLALEANKLGYEVGVRVNIDVLNAEQQVQNTRRDLAKARFETLMAQLKLKAAVGNLVDEDLNTLNQLLENTKP